MAYTYDYPRPAVTADCVVMTKEADPQVLLIQRGGEPYRRCWAIPGGFMDMDETAAQCAVRELEEETGLRLSDVHQIGAYSKVDRDPRGRTVSIAYLTIVDVPLPATGLDDAGLHNNLGWGAISHQAADAGGLTNSTRRLQRTILCHGGR